MKRILLAVCGAATAATLVSAQTTPSTSSPTTQTPQTQTGTMDRDRDPSRERSDDRNITVTGCLRSGDAAGQYVLAKPPSDMSGTSASSSAPGASSTSPTGSSPSASGTAGQTGSATAGTSGTLSGAAAWSLGDKYRLSGKSDELSRHLNHKVEITGTLGKAGAGMSGTGAATGADTSGTGSAGATGSTSGAPGSATASGTGSSTAQSPHTTGSGTAASAAGQASRALPQINVKSVRMISESCS